MVSDFSSRPEDLVAAIGPSIGACCYTVGEQVHATFIGSFPDGETLFSRSSSSESVLHLDLWEANRRQLLSAGLSDSQIRVVGECTGCTGAPIARRYFSHRCESGFTGRMMSVIGIDPA